MSLNKGQDPLFHEVAKFLSEYRSEPLHRITLETRLREDLQISGDDVDELLQWLIDRFQVDLAAFDFYRYFREEPHLAWLFTQLWHARRRGRWGTEPVTVGDLMRTIRAKRWIAPTNRQDDSQT